MGLNILYLVDRRNTLQKQIESEKNQLKIIKIKSSIVIINELILQLLFRESSLNTITP